MASKKSVRCKKDRLVAKVIEGDVDGGPCAFCGRTINDELQFGKLYSIGDIYCHYFCVLLSSCLVQKGDDEDGLLGFLYTDIQAEVERSRKHRCSYCGKGGATLGCCISQCRKQFHVPCGRERSSASLFYGNYKSFCCLHAPQQQVAGPIMEKAKVRRAAARKALKHSKPGKTNESKTLDVVAKADYAAKTEEPESICVICYEPVPGYPSTETFWPPCCANDEWFHRTCLQRFALSAGMHYLKCPLCNDKHVFYRAVLEQGYFLPDRDAAWELEQNAFAGMYERQVTCGAEPCLCPSGRSHDEEHGAWDIKLCLLCGSRGSHVACLPAGAKRFLCDNCEALGAQGLDELEQKISAVILQEQTQAASQQRRASGMVMPSRMSIRRTKRRPDRDISSRVSSQATSRSSSVSQESSEHTQLSRAALNLKPPSRAPRSLTLPRLLRGVEHELLSPVKLLQSRLLEKLSGLEDDQMYSMVLDSSRVIEEVRKRFDRPRPLSAKTKIADKIIEKLLNEMSQSLHETSKQLLPQGLCDRKYVSEVKEAPEETNKQSPPQIKLDFDIPKDEDRNETENNANNITEDDTTELATNDANEAVNENCEDVFPNVDIAIEDNKEISPKLAIEDDSSSSTFQLPPEFIANGNSNDSQQIFETPKKLNIGEDSSTETSAKEGAYNDIFQINSNKETITSLDFQSPTRTYDFNPLQNKQDMKTANDIEIFKKKYLHEVGKDYKCEFNHKHINKETNGDATLQTVIDFALDAILEKENNLNEALEVNEDTKERAIAIKKTFKRKIKSQFSTKYSKKRKTTDDNVIPDPNENKETTINFTLQSTKAEKKSKRKTKKKRRERTVIDLKVGTSKSGKRFKKLKKSHRKNNTHVSFKNKNIKVKIRMREARVHLKITNKNNTDDKNNFKQTVLQFSPDNVSSKNIIVTPEGEVTPMKKKKIKQEKLHDGLKQTSIQSFFKIKSPQTSE